MGIMNFFKIGGKHYAYTTDKPKMTKREFLSKLHATLCCVETDEPIVVQQKFEKINVAQYTDEQIKVIFNRMKPLIDQIKKYGH